MVQLVLTDEQAKLLTESSGDVIICDSAGRHLGYVSQGFTAKDIAEAQRRLAMPGPRLWTAEVLEKLNGLERK